MHGGDEGVAGHGLALLVTGANREFDVYCFPFNDDWEIAHSEFTEGSDGLYLGGVGLRFHHNLVSNMQDDGIYLSSPSPYMNDDIHIHHNLVREIFSTFACNSTGGPTGAASTGVFIRTKNAWLRATSAASRLSRSV